MRWEKSHIVLVLSLAGAIITIILPVMADHTPSQTAQQILAWKPILSRIAVAFILISAVAWYIDYRDHRHDISVRTPRQVEDLLGINCLGVIPKWSSPDIAWDFNDPRSGINEAYLSVVGQILTHQRLEFSVGAVRSLLVASAEPAVGKSISALAIAKIFARQGLRTLLIDADMRKPSFRFSNTSNGGLSNIMARAGTANDYIIKPEYEDFYLLPSGPIPPNPAELLLSNVLSEVMVDLVGKFDVVIVDGPPIIGIADAPRIAESVEGVIFAVGYNQTISTIDNALRRLKGARVVGGIITMAPSSWRP